MSPFGSNSTPHPGYNLICLSSYTNRQLLFGLVCFITCNIFLSYYYPITGRKNLLEELTSNPHHAAFEGSTALSQVRGLSDAD